MLLEVKEKVHKLKKVHPLGEEFGIAIEAQLILPMDALRFIDITNPPQPTN